MIAGKATSCCVGSTSFLSHIMAHWQWHSNSLVPTIYIIFLTAATALLVGGIIFVVLSNSKASVKSSGLATYARFFYASFLKPHTGDGEDTGQQAALESFYKAQVRGINSLDLHLS